MELTRVAKTKILPHNSQSENLPISLVSELLVTMITNQSEEILIEGQSHDFLYDSDTGILAGTTLNIWLTNKKVTQRDSSIEITLSGIIANREGGQKTLTLYFYMWWDHTQLSPIKNSSLKNLHALPLRTQPLKTTKRLADSVFELDLYRRSPSLQQEHMGQGRGYLVFGQNKEDTLSKTH